MSYYTASRSILPRFYGHVSEDIRPIDHNAGAREPVERFWGGVAVAVIPDGNERDLRRHGAEELVGRGVLRAVVSGYEHFDVRQVR